MKPISIGGNSCIRKRWRDYRAEDPDTASRPKRSPDGYDIICDQARGVLMTEKRYSSRQSLNAYFITKCRGRYLLTDSLSSLFND
jgi:hypothetical protein